MRIWNIVMFAVAAIGLVTAIDMKNTLAEAGFLLAGVAYLRIIERP